MDKQYVAVTGAGLDYKSWNGILLADNNGAAFAIRVRYVVNGELISQNEIYDSINEVGSRASDSVYANVGNDMMDLKWSAQANTVFGKITAKQDMEVIIEAYRPYPEAGKYYTEGNSIIGCSPEVLRDPGISQVTGGYAITWNRSSFVKEFAGNKSFFGAKIMRQPDNLYEVSDDKLLPVKKVDETEPLEALAFGYNVEKDDCIYLVCSILPEEGLKPDYGADEIQMYITNGQKSHMKAYVDGDGDIGKVIRPMNNMLYWITTYNPYLKYCWITLGRPWMEYGKWNVWGWDECLAAIIAALESQELAENCIKIAYQDERAGPYAAWKVYSRYGNKEILTEVLYYFSKYYSDDDLVYCQKGNWHVGKGMDDTTMRDLEGESMISLDASAQKCWNFEILAKIAEALGEQQATKEYETRYANLKQRINETLWNDELGIYLNRYINGGWCKHKSPTSFYPMLAGCPTEEMLKRLVEHLINENEFWGEYVIVTLSKDDPDYGIPSTYGHPETEYPPYSYWRGNIWAPTNYFVYEGLKRCKQDDVAAKFAQKSVALWWKNWVKYNYACENYHPITGERSPMGHKHYNWSMLLPLIGIEEIIDVDVWGQAFSLRFGNHVTKSKNVLKNIYIQNEKYDVISDLNYLEVRKNDKVVFIANSGTVTVSNFIYSGNKVQFDINVVNQVHIQLPEMSREMFLDSGFYHVKS